jgi:allophanate hydrolase
MDDPIEPNTRLGTYTNFTNLLDLAGIAVPSGAYANGIPTGITLLGPAFSDARLASLAQRYHQATGLSLGATGLPQPRLPAATLAAISPDDPQIVVIGAHLSGEPLNGELVSAGGRLVRPCATQPIYRLWALPGNPARPGLLRVATGGTAIEGEVWSLSPEGFGRFVATIPAPLGIGRIELADGSSVQGFLCEGYAVEGAVEISEFGGWRAYHAAAIPRK